MSLKSPYHKIVSTVTLAVMLWNIIGWLGTGLIMNYMHSHNEGNHCEVSFCNCEVKDGHKYCTCHHPELHQNNDGKTDDSHHSNNDENSDYCFYTSPHPVDNNTSDAMIVFAKFNALYQNQDFIFQPFESTTLIPDRFNSLLSGFQGNLLRPPRQ